MNRSEYLMALYDALDGIPTQERTDAVSEYREYFISEIEKGRTEDEICVSLGDPITLAYAIKQRRGYGANKQETFYEKPRRTHGVFRKVASAVTVTVILFTVFYKTIFTPVKCGPYDFHHRFTAGDFNSAVGAGLFDACPQITS